MDLGFTFASIGGVKNQKMEIFISHLKGKFNSLSLLSFENIYATPKISYQILINFMGDKYFFQA